MTLDEDHVLHTFAMCRVWQKESTGGRSDTQKCHWRQERSAARSAPLRHPTVRTATSRRTGPASLCHPGTDDNSESCRRSVCRLRELKKQRNPARGWSGQCGGYSTIMHMHALRGSLHDSHRLAPTEQQTRLEAVVSLCKFIVEFRLDLSRKMFRDGGGLKIVKPAVWA